MLELKLFNTFKYKASNMQATVGNVIKDYMKADLNHKLELKLAPSRLAKPRLTVSNVLNVEAYS